MMSSVDEPKRKRSICDDDDDEQNRKKSRSDVTDEQSDIINNYYKLNQQTDDYFEQKMELRTELYEFLKESSYPRCGLFIVGSSMNGFGTKNSDLDLCMMISHREIVQKKEGLDILRILQKALRPHPFTNIQVIPAKVPILRFKDTMSQIEVDLNINNAIGIRNTHLLGTYARLDWRVKPLMLYIKKWAQFHDINCAMNMTFSSYSLTLMMIHLLQDVVQPPVLPCLQTLCPTRFTKDSDIRNLSLTDELPDFTSSNDQSLYELFLKYLEYYALDFDFEKDVISIRLGTKLKKDKVAHGDPRGWSYVCIEEPFELNNVARSVFDSYGFAKIRRVFETSAKALKEQGKVDDLFERPY